MSDSIKRRELCKDEEVSSLVNNNLWSNWSVWKPCIIPDIFYQSLPQEERSNWEQRNSQQFNRQHWYSKATNACLLAECSDEICAGIYEFAVTPCNKELSKENRCVVYIGSTCVRAKNSLHQRLKRYMVDGSHIWGPIQLTLEKGFVISARWVRFKENASSGELTDSESSESESELVVAKPVDESYIKCAKEEAENMENTFLAKYDYAWNRRENGGYEHGFRDLLDLY